MTCFNVNRCLRLFTAFIRASENVATAAALLDALSATSTDGVGEVYQWLKSILCVAAVQ
jgi:hypothetical protein